MSEKDICIMESEINAAVDEYIAARPQLDSIHNRRIYESGFKAGYGKLEKENKELKYLLKVCYRNLHLSEDHLASFARDMKTNITLLSRAIKKSGAFDEDIKG